MLSQLFDLIRSLGAPFSMIAAICLFFAAVGVVGAIAAMFGAIAKEIRKFACHREELDFKRELLDRGMTADEVERLVQVRHEQK